jgi:uncharacterized protein (TIGR02996 family)
MTDAELEAIAARVMAATAGPWDAIREEARPERGAILVAAVGGGRLTALKYVRTEDSGHLEACFRRIEDADFVAKARTDVPLLLGLVSALRDRVTLLSLALDAEALGLVGAVAEDEPGARGAYADWLEDRGRAAQATYLRGA